MENGKVGLFMAAVMRDAEALDSDYRAVMEKRRRAVKARLRRREMDAAMESLGMVKVRGSVSGKVYYE